MKYNKCSPTLKDGLMTSRTFKLRLDAEHFRCQTLVADISTVYALSPEKIFPMGPAHIVVIWLCCI